jgi:hypothetical protein
MILMPYTSFADGNDPTQPYHMININPDYSGLFDEEVESDTEIVLQAIMNNKNKNVAIINNIMVHEGDELKGYKIKKINADNVLVESETQKLELKISMVAKIKD